MKNLQENAMLDISGGVCALGEHGLEIHFGECFTVCNLLQLMNPTFTNFCPA
jgi:hypothetical protein